MPTDTGTSLGAKVKLVFALAVFGIVASIVISVKDQPIETRIPADEDLTEQVVLSVIWKPGRREDDPIKIEATVDGVMLLQDGVPIDQKDFVQSPYNAIVTIPKGAKVRLTAFQPTDGQLDCLIVVKDRTKDHRDRSSRGAITCKYN